MMRALLCSLVGHQRAAAREIKVVAGGITTMWETCPRCGQQHRIDSPAAILLRTVSQGHIIPAGYGIAWVDWRTGDALAMPIPLNIAAAGARRTWFWFRHPAALVKDPRQAFLQGYQAGLRAGQQHHGDGGAS